MRPGPTLNLSDECWAGESSTPAGLPGREPRPTAVPVVTVFAFEEWICV